MKNKPFRTLLKIWITAASLGAFFFGWSVLGHSGKPVAATSIDTSGNAATSANSQIAPLPTLAPLPPIGSPQSLQPLIQQQAPATIFSQPRFRTRGS
jgi:hypothetical protein